MCKPILGRDRFSNANSTLQPYIDGNVKTLEMIIFQELQKATLQQQIESLNQRIKTIEKEVEKKSNIMIWVTLILTWLVLRVFAYFLYRLWNRCAKLKNTILENDEKSGNKNDIVNIVVNSDSLKRKIKDNITTDISQNENLINIIVDRVQECLVLNREEKGYNKRTDLTENKQSVKYLKGLSGNTFSRVVDTREDNCFYKLVNEKDGTAELEYCGTIDDARSQFNAIFDNVSDTEGSASNAKNVKTATRGKVKFADGKWVVTEKVTIKFE